MPDLSTKYMGLALKNPIIAGSSGLTRSVENIVELEKQGAAAVVLKSLFEEQIRHESSLTLSESSIGQYYSEAEDYIHNYSKEGSIDEYLELIRQARRSVDIPVIASINCVTASEWTGFASRIQEAGAHGLELNVFILPSDPYQGGEENEKIYFDIVSRVKKQVRIPVALKISHYFSGLAKTALKLSWTGIDGMVLFNRFFSPDIDIQNLKV
ncbi:MAG TPA: diguanylate cyclase, partial [Bacteroidales bacterium]|nr:diguanylate cyclase [Bacteroidales bacterium]